MKPRPKIGRLEDWKIRRRLLCGWKAKSTWAQQSGKTERVEIFVEHTPPPPLLLLHHLTSTGTGRN